MEKVLGKLRQSRKPALLYGLVPEMAGALLREVTEPVLHDLGLPFIEIHAARCCVREWGHHYRTRTGSALAQHIEWSLAKYRDQGVNVYVLEQLLVVIDEAVGPRLEAGNASSQE
jgi:hypothetical protein